MHDSILIKRLTDMFYYYSYRISLTKQGVYGSTGSIFGSMLVCPGKLNFEARTTVLLF